MVNSPETRFTDQEVKDAALRWLREAWGIPEAQWVQGTPGDGSRCAIAQVLIAGGYSDVMVDETAISAVLPDGELFTLVPPPLVREFIERFDGFCYPTLVHPDFPGIAEEERADFQERLELAKSEVAA